MSVGKDILNIAEHVAVGALFATPTLGLSPWWAAAVAGGIINLLWGTLREVEQRGLKIEPISKPGRRLVVGVQNFGLHQAVEAAAWGVGGVLPAVLWGVLR